MRWNNLKMHTVHTSPLFFLISSHIGTFAYFSCFYTYKLNSLVWSSLPWDEFLSTLTFLGLMISDGCRRGAYFIEILIRWHQYCCSTKWIRNFFFFSVGILQSSSPQRSANAFCETSLEHKCFDLKKKHIKKSIFSPGIAEGDLTQPSHLSSISLWSARERWNCRYCLRHQTLALWACTPSHNNDCFNNLLLAYRFIFRKTEFASYWPIICCFRIVTSKGWNYFKQHHQSGVLVSGL